MIKFSTKNIIGLLLTYFMIALNQTHLSEFYLNKYSVIILLVFTGLLFLKSKTMFSWSLICLIPLTVIMFLLRFTVGGIGVGTLISFACSIMVCSYLVAYNKENTLMYFVKVCVFLAGVSVALWIFCLLFPNVWTNIIPGFKSSMVYRIYTDTSEYTSHYYSLNGLFLYSMRQVDYQRNTGIFTEPGVYQMVLNTALFILIFMKDSLPGISNRKIKKYIIIIMITLVTTQSTTGYIGGFLLLVFGMFANKGLSKSMKKTITIGFLGALCTLIYDYIKRGSASLLYIAIIEKLYSSNMGFAAITTGSGGARWGTIDLALQSMLQHPFGIGYDNFGALLNTEDTGYLAASIVAFGAVWGVFTLALVLWWLFSPVKKSSMATSSKWLYVFLYFNTTLAQSTIFYTSLILIPLSIYYVNNLIIYNKQVKGEIDEDTMDMQCSDTSNFENIRR